jgi:hypothetical protein
MLTQNQTRNGRATVEVPVPTFVANGIENGRERLHAIESQAQGFLRDLQSRGVQEIASIKERLPVAGLRERLPVEEITDRAKDLESETRQRAEALVEDVERRVSGLHDRALALVGAASRDQVAALARDLDRLSKRIDRLVREARSGKAPAKKAAARKAPATKKKTGGRGTGSSRR